MKKPTHQSRVCIVYSGGCCTNPKLFFTEMFCVFKGKCLGKIASAHLGNYCNVTDHRNGAIPEFDNMIGEHLCKLSEYLVFFTHRNIEAKIE